MYSFHIRALAVFLFISSALVGAHADTLPLETTKSAPNLAAKSVLMIDATTGTILYEKDADIVIPPASLTKLMTMHVVFEAISAGKASLDDPVQLPKETWAASQPWDSSLMHLAPGQRVSLREIMLGLAVASGNDAAVAAALHIAGSVEEFVKLMNEEAQQMGLSHTHFVEPSGYSENNVTTAREFAIFCREYLKRHTNAIDEFHSVKSFVYPEARNIPEIFADRNQPIDHKNRNLLLGMIDGVDGLKTGYIIESGYNLALTAKRDGTRLLAILLGGPGNSSVEGSRTRAADGKKLITWGFDQFRTIRPVVEQLEDARVWKGQKKAVALIPAAPLEFTVGKNRAKAVAWEVRHTQSICAPITVGDVLGEIIFSDESGELNRVALVAKEAVPRGSFFKRTLDTIVLFFMKVFGKQA